MSDSCNPFRDTRPIIADPHKDLSGEPCDLTGTPTKELHKIHRTLPPLNVTNPETEILQDEDGFGFLTETDAFIFDNFK